MNASLQFGPGGGLYGNQDQDPQPEDDDTMGHSMLAHSNDLPGPEPPQAP